MKFENTEVWGFQHAIRGMRNSHESWEMSDSSFGAKVAGTGKSVRAKSIIRDFGDVYIEYAVIGENDLRLMQSLIKAGSEHRTFMRQIFVSVDVTASLFWWKKADQYKVDIVSDSCSTMHELASTPITIDCFEVGEFRDCYMWSILVSQLEFMRQRYNKVLENKKHLEEIKEFEEARKAQEMAEKCWSLLIRLLPESWLQKQTIAVSYENVLNMVRQRKDHKLAEWSEFVEWAHTLPYADELLFL